MQASSSIDLRWVKPLKNRGVITGVDGAQEWLLPLWFKALTKHSSLPVTFIDFGMSKSAKNWCMKKGSLTPFSHNMDFVKTQSELCPILTKFWRRIYPGDVWAARSMWFKKPLALLLSPYRQTVWLDIDCQVKGPLEPLYKPLNEGYGIALCRSSPCYERSSRAVGLAHKDEKVFNSGVIAYNHGEPLVSEWATLCMESSHQFLGDENVLNRVLFKKQARIYELPLRYNLPYFMQPQHEGQIIHYLSKKGKNALLKQV